MNYDMYGGGALSMIYITYSNFVVIAINLFLAIKSRRKRYNGHNT